MPIRNFRDYIFFEIKNEDKELAYMSFVSNKFCETSPQTYTDIDEMLVELYKILDPFLDICKIQGRRVVLTIDMKDTSMMNFYFKLIKYLIQNLHDHIKAINVTERCEIINASAMIRLALNFVKPFVKESFRDKMVVVGEAEEEEIDEEMLANLSKDID